MAGFHSRTVPLASAVASRVLSGLKATPITPVRAGIGPESSAGGLSGGGIPEAYGAVAIGAGQQVAVGAERHPCHSAVGWITGQDAVLLLLSQQSS